MSRNLKAVLAMILVIVMLSACLSFAAAAEVISPADKSISYSDSLLVSVKVSEAKPVRITVFQEMDSIEVTTKDEKGKPVTATELIPLDVANLTEEDLNAMVDVYEGKVTDGAIMTTGVKAAKYTASVYSEPVVYQSKTNIGIYTQQLSEVKPGFYRVQVETLDYVEVKPDKKDKTVKIEKPEKKEVVTETVNSYVLVKEKPAEGSNIFETKGGVLQVVKEVLKSIFK